MKKFCLLSVLFLFTLFVSAQGDKGTVYLKNGSVLKGKFEWTQNLQKLRVESAGNIWVFNADEVDRVLGRNELRMTWLEMSPVSGFFYRAELGILAGNSQNSQPAPFSFTGSVNYAIVPRFSAGAGFGTEFFKESYLPAFLNLEYKFRPSWSSPYFFMKAGYQVPLEESREVYQVWPAWSSVWPPPWPGPFPNRSKLEAKGGMLLNPGMGYSHMFSYGFGMSVAFGYQFHRLLYTGENDYRLEIDYNRLSVKLGFIFN
jgi:hypothetical protein